MGTAAATKIDGAENKLDTILDSANDLKFRVDAKEEELEKAAEDSKNAYENYKPAPFGH